MAKCDRGRESVNGEGSEWKLPTPGNGPEMEWREISACGYLGSLAIFSHCVLSRPLAFRRINRYLCYGFFLIF